MLTVGAYGATPADEEAFQQDLLPILTKHCAECHSGDEPEAGLNLSSRGALLHGSTAGRVLAPGKSAASLMVQLVTRNGKPHMPPEGQLSDAEIKVLSNWIDRLQDGDLSARSPGKVRDHWSFRPLVRPSLPAVRNPDWVANPIDAYVLAKLDAAGLSPSSPADPRTLIRRATFDLTGLPPTPEEVEAFHQSAIRNPHWKPSSTVCSRRPPTASAGDGIGWTWLVMQTAAVFMTISIGRTPGATGTM